MERSVFYLNGSIKNEFPNSTPNATYAYWLHHNQLVDEALSLQKEIINKVIDILGLTIQKVVNPIRFSSSDLFT